MRHFTFGTCAAALCVGMLGQDVALAAASDQIEDIVVVARRREENLQNVPLAITAMTGADLNARGLSRAEDLAQAIPGMKITSTTNRGDADIVLRGQATAPAIPGNRPIPSVTSYFAEVPTALTGPGAFIDLQSVQVVKGPQGTLFGRNTTGGAILLLPQKPKNEFGGYVTGQLGNYSDREIEDAINIPIVKDRLNLRLTTKIAHRDGFTENVATGKGLDDVGYQYYRAGIDFKPTDSLDNYLLLGFQNVHEHGSSHISYSVNPDQVLRPNFLLLSPAVSSFAGPPDNYVSPFFFGGASRATTTQFANGFVGCIGSPNPNCLAGVVAGVSTSGGLGTAAAPTATGSGLAIFPTLESSFARQQALGPRKVDDPFQNLDKEQHFNITNITTYDLASNLTIKNILGYRLDQVTDRQDELGTDLLLLRQNNGSADGWQENYQQMSEEFQLQGKSFGRRLDWIMGTYLEFDGTGPGDSRTRATSAGLTQTLRQVAIDDTSKSIFGEATYDFRDWVEGLKFTAGLRQNWDTRKATLETCDLTLGTHCSVQTAPVLVRSGSYRNLSYDFTLQYAFNDHLTTYAGIKRSYRPGGFIMPAPAVGSSTFGSETLVEVEVGAKYGFHALSGPGHLNVALYRDHYIGRQVGTGIVTAADGGVAIVTSNLGTTDDLGVEVDGSVTPFQGFNLSAWWSYIHAPYGTDFRDAATGQVLQTSSDQVINTPVSKYGVSGIYTVPYIPDTLGTVSLRADWSWQAHYLYDVHAADPGAHEPSYGLLNMRLDWSDIAGSHVSASMFVTNALDKLYRSGVIATFYTLGADSAVYGEPRMFGGTITYKFGAEAE